jgi:hypothetical protein
MVIHIKNNNKENNRETRETHTHEKKEEVRDKARNLKNGEKWRLKMNYRSWLLNSTQIYHQMTTFFY